MRLSHRLPCTSTLPARLLVATVLLVCGSANASGQAMTAPDPFAFLVGEYRVIGAGEGEPRVGRSTFTPIAGAIEEVRTEAGREVARALVRLEDDGRWHYARADGARQRMLVYAGPFERTATLALATTTDGEARIILDQLSVTGFRLRFQELRGMAWATVRTERYERAAHSEVPSAQPLSAPSCDGPVDAFDFWVGAWEVTDSSATRVFGHSLVTPVVNGCALRMYGTAGEERGISLSMFDPVRQEWSQVWMDSTQRTVHLNGGLQGAAMVLIGIRDGGGFDRITWTPLADGHVRQHWEQNRPGSAWTTFLDVHYRRRR